MKCAREKILYNFLGKYFVTYRREICGYLTSIISEGKKKNLYEMVHKRNLLSKIYAF